METTYLQDAIALIALAAMEIVLGIDNVVFISILSGRLPAHQQAMARWTGLIVAAVLRIVLLFSISYIMGLTKPVFELSQLGMFGQWLATHAEVNEVSWRDIILVVGGLFLIRSSVLEMHHKIEGAHDEHATPKTLTFGSVIAQIALLDIIFSLDSVITAVGMVEPEKIWIMVVAILIAVAVMMIFAGTVSAFVERHPTVKMLALSFLLLIGVMLVAEGIGTHINKGYIYFAMAFSLGVEMLNLWMKANAARRKQRAEDKAAGTVAKA